MRPQLPSMIDVQAFVRRVMHPKTKLGKTTLWFGYLTVGLQILVAIFRPGPNSFLGGWTTLITFLFVCGALLMLLRWARQKMMWRLRNRLIVTYIFIGIIPIVLLLCMALVAGYLFAGQFATYVATSDLQSELNHLAATNRSMATQFGRLAKDNRLSPQLAAEIASASDENFRHRTVTVWDGEGSFMLGEPGQAPPQAVKVPQALKSDFAGFVLEGDRLQLRALRRLDAGPHRLIVISNLPITSQLLHSATSELGEVTLYPPAGSEEKPVQSSSTAVQNAPKSHVVVQMGDSNYNVSHGSEPRAVVAGSLPAPANAFDFQITFGTKFELLSWSSQNKLTGLMGVETRPSMLYATLFSTLGQDAGAVRYILIGIAIFFGIIELVALIIGVRLTRSMTRSVAELYTATEHVNRGELTHRIKVRTSDQMAALEQSFNSMTQSLSTLIAEQKEKQRMESELAIAHEVQNLLFPADLSGLPSLEVHGVCRPARTVSGDYYDFIPLNGHRMLLAVGDISGKGISAALLMATVHAFVRAYSLEPQQTLAPVALGAGASQDEVRSLSCGPSVSDSEVSPASLMGTLNYQLFRSTPPEKYATMFLGSYDALSRALTYSNAGHLPPLVLGTDGEIRRLDISGTVVGLFDNMTYEESRVSMRPGDIFIAYSDGVTEPENEFGEFGEERLIELVRQHREEPLARISELVTSAVSDWIAGGEQPDDITLVLARAR